MSEPNQSPRLVRRFVEILGLIARGDFERSLDDGMRKAVEAIRAQPGEKGKAMINISIEIAAQGEMMQVKPKLTMKLPEGDVFTPLVLWDHEGAFSLQHPSQIDMFQAPRAVKTDSAEPKAAVAAE
jgi:hypothetical protein